MIKCLKGYTRSSLLHRDAYLAVLRMCDAMDDTVLVNKMLLAELHKNEKDDKKEGDDDDDENKPSPILDLVLSDTGSKLFLLLLVSKDEETTTSPSSDANDKKSTATTPRWQKYLDPYELSVLHRNPTVTENDGETVVPTSKKEDETRRQELAVYLKELLIEVCTKHTEEMMRSKPGSRVLMEVCESFPSEEVFNAIVDVCAETSSKDTAMVEDPVGHLTLKHMFLSESKQNESNDDGDDDDDEPSLARMFYSKFDKSLGDIATSNRGAFVLSALIQVPSVHDAVKSALKGCKKDIAKLAKGGGGKDGAKKLAGCGVLLDALK